MLQAIILVISRVLGFRSLFLFVPFVFYSVMPRDTFFFFFFYKSSCLAFIPRFEAFCFVRKVILILVIPHIPIIAT